MRQQAAIVTQRLFLKFIIEKYHVSDMYVTAYAIYINVNGNEANHTKNSNSKT